MMYKLLLLICVIFLYLPSWSQDKCSELLKPKALTVVNSDALRKRPAWFGDMRVNKKTDSIRAFLVDLDQDQTVQIRNIFGDFEIHIIHSGNLFFVIHPRSNESTDRMKYILQSVLNFYFGENNVFETNSYQSKIRSIRIQHFGLSEDELAEKIKLSVDRLAEIPSKNFIIKDIIKAEHPFGEGLLDIHSEFFADIPEEKFMKTLRRFIPFFINTLPPHQNFIFKENIFSTSDLTDNPESFEFVRKKIRDLFGKDINVIQERIQIRQKFIENLRFEFEEGLVFENNLAKWKNLENHPNFISKSEQAIYLSRTSDLSSEIVKNSSALSGLVYTLISNPPHSYFIYKVEKPLGNTTTDDESLRTFDHEERQVTGAGVNLFLSPRVYNRERQVINENKKHDDLSFEVNYNISQGVKFKFEDLPLLEETAPRTLLEELNVSEELMHKLRFIPNIETVEDLAIYPADKLQADFNFEKEDFLELLPALTELGIDLQVPQRWDKENYRLIEKFPEYKIPPPRRRPPRTKLEF